METVLGILVFTCILVYLVVFAYRMHLDNPHVNARIQGEQQRKQQAVVERRTETVTEKVVIELIPNEELSQSLANLIGSINNSTDATNHHATVIETTAQIIPFSIGKPVETSVEIDMPNTVQELSKDSPGVVQEVSREELVKQYLLEHPEASVREIERETGVPKTTVANIKREL